MNTNKCFLCNHEADINEDPIDLYNVECITCGKYRITWEATEDKIPECKKTYILSGLSRAASDKNSSIFINTENFDELISSSIIPDNPIEMIDRILIHIAENTPTFAKAYEFKDTDYTIAYVKNEERQALSSSKFNAII